MPTDICMCTGGDCPQKEHCLRFTGAIYGRQDFFGTPPYLQHPNQCEYFLDDRPSPEWARYVVLVSGGSVFIGIAKALISWLVKLLIINDLTNQPTNRHRPRQLHQSDEKNRA
jgi:hypothetical protein